MININHEILLNLMIRLNHNDNGGQRMIQKPSNNAPLIEWAMFYARLNKPIIPVYEVIKNAQCSCFKKDCTSIGKHPRVKNGSKDATTDLSIIQQWWTKWPDANIGIATGTASHQIVLDIDPRHGGNQSLEHIETIYQKIVANQVKSGGNGWHFYFDIDSNAIFKNRVNLLPGCDIRGEGGYIVAPPSSHVSGMPYEWIDFDDAKHPVPNWLLVLLNTKCFGLEPNKNINENIVGSGSRNNFLTSVSGVLRKYGFEGDTIAGILKDFNKNHCHPALDDSEVFAIAKSVSRYENSIPNDAWDEIKLLPNTQYHVPVMDESFTITP